MRNRRFGQSVKRHQVPPSLQLPWLQVVCAAAGMAIVGNFQYSWSLFVMPIQAAHATQHWKLAEVQWGFTLFILFETWTMPLQGLILDRFQPQRLLLPAGIISVVAWTGLGFVHSLWQLYLTYAISGIGAALVYLACMECALRALPNRRGLAMGLLVAGFSSGSAAVIPAILWLLRITSYTTTLISLGLAKILLFLAIASIAGGGRTLPSSSSNRAEKEPSSGEGNTSDTDSVSPTQMLRTPRFYVLFAMFTFIATSGIMITANAMPLALEWGISNHALAYALVFDRISNAAGRVFWGWVSDRMRREVAMATAFACHAAALTGLLYLGRSSPAAFIVLLVLTFATYGEIFGLFPVIALEYFGHKHVKANYGILYTAKGVASVLGGPAAAIVFEHTRTWSAALFANIVMAAIASVMALALHFTKRVPTPTFIATRRSSSP